jgi:hypothetical protein
MARATQYGGILIPIAWILGLVGSSRMAAQETVLPQPIKEALDRYKELKTLSVTWTEEAHRGPSGIAKFGEPSSTKSGLPPVRHLDWQEGKLYWRRIIGGREWKGGPGIRRDEYAFDGRIWAGGCPDQVASDGKRRTPGLQIELAAEREPNAGTLGVDVFDQPMGIRFPRGAGELLRAKPVVSQLLFMLENGGQLTAVGPAQIDGRAMTRVVVRADNPQWQIVQKTDLAALEKSLRANAANDERTIKGKLAIAKRRKETTPRTLQYVWYLDAELGYAVRRFEVLTEDGRRRSQSECTDHQQLPGHKIWPPWKCRTDEYFTYADPGELYPTPFRTELIDVLEFETKPVPEAQFSLNYTIPGTRITDKTLPEAKLAQAGVTYVVPSNPEDLDRVIEEARTLAQLKASRAARVWWFKMLVIVGNILALAAVVACVVVRYRRKVAKTS